MHAVNVHLIFQDKATI